MAEHAHSTPTSGRAQVICALIAQALIIPFFLAVIIIGLGTPDRVVAGHAYAVEAAR